MCESNITTSNEHIINYCLKRMFRMLLTSQPMKHVCNFKMHGNLILCSPAEGKGVEEKLSTSKNMYLSLTVLTPLLYSISRQIIYNNNFCCSANVVLINNINGNENLVHNHFWYWIVKNLHKYLYICSYAWQRQVMKVNYLWFFILLIITDEKKYNSQKLLSCKIYSLLT